MHIAIAGNIGSGKTTLTRMLAKHYGWDAKFEAVTDNPYLEDFYADIVRWSFNLEVFFLKHRFKDMLVIPEFQDVQFLFGQRGRGESIVKHIPNALCV